MTDRGKDTEVNEISALASELVPPPHLEEAVVARLRRAGAIAPRRLSRRLALAAALFAGFGSGLLAGLPIGARVGTDREPAPAAASAPSRFVLLLWESDRYRPAAAGERAGRVAEYAAWAASLRAEGTRVAGEKLADDVRWVSSDDVPDRENAPPEARSAGELGGYFVLEAASIEVARRIAATCPHARYGGDIEIRPLAGTAAPAGVSRP